MRFVTRIHQITLIRISSSLQPHQYVGQLDGGAIAGDGDNPIVGISAEITSKREAEKSAIADCEKNGGSNCVIKISCRNQCAAIVTGDKRYGSYHAESIEVAAGLGMKDCRANNDTNCRVYYSGCSMPVRIQ